MNHNIQTKRFTTASLRRDRSAHTVLLRMAQDADRAERIKALKADRPDLTWGQLAEAVNVSERSVLGWAQKGTISYANAKKLAAFLKVDADWIWSGRTGESPNLMAVLDAGSDDRLGRIEAKLDALSQAVDQIARAIGVPGSDDTTLGERMKDMTDQFAAQLARLHEAPQPPPRSTPRKRPAPATRR